MEPTIFAVFDDKTPAARAMKNLEEAGFPKTDICLVASPAGLKGRMQPTRNLTKPAILAGAVLGAVVGALLPLVPGLGLSFQGAGLLLLIVGTGGGAVLGIFTAGLIAAGMESAETKQADYAVDHGKVMVRVLAAEGPQASRAREILEAAGGKTQGGGHGSQQSDEVLSKPID